MTTDPELTTDDLARSGGAREQDVGGDDRLAAQPTRASAPGPEGYAPTAGRDMGSRAMGGQSVAPEDSVPGSGMGTTVPGATVEDAGFGQGGHADRETGTDAFREPPVGIGQERSGLTTAEAGHPTPAPAGGTGDGGDVALLDPADGESFRQRWSDVQARFVDDPQDAVKTADGLVAELMQSLAQGFSQHKDRLESAWQRGGNPDTEELRQALRRYRSFFDRLLST